MARGDYPTNYNATTPLQVGGIRARTPATQGAEFGPKGYLRPKIKMQDPRGLPKNHPLKDEECGRYLCDYIIERVRFGYNVYQPWLRDRFFAIDSDVFAYMRMTREARERRADQIWGNSREYTDVRLAWLMMHLDDAVAYLLQVFSPEAGFFQTATGRHKMDLSRLMTKLLNDSALHTGYRWELAKFIWDFLKYNLGAFHVEWLQQYGNQLSTTEGGQEAQLSHGVVWEGNCVQSLNMYNVFWDPSVHPVDVHMKGEWVAFTEMWSNFRLQRLANEGVLFNVDKLLQSPNVSHETILHKSAPKFKDALTSTWAGYESGLHNTSTGYGTGDGEDWYRILSGGHTQDVIEGSEILTAYIWLNPKQFNLEASTTSASTRETERKERFEIYRVMIGAQREILAVDHMPNGHGRLPIVFASPTADNLGMYQKSWGENLAPFSNIASTQMNMHVRSLAANYVDLTLYDPTVIPLQELGDHVAGQVPVMEAGWGKPVGDAIWTKNTNLDTRQNMQDARSVLDLMQDMFPTGAGTSQQLANMDRAVEQQVVNTVFSNHRRLFKIASITDDQAMRPLRFMLMWNNLQFQPAFEIENDDGTRQTVSRQRMIDAKLEYEIDNGLGLMDRMQQVARLENMINRILQSQHASQAFDLPRLIDYVSKLSGLNANIAQFAIPTADPNAQALQRTVAAEQAAIQNGQAGPTLS